MRSKSVEARRPEAEARGSVDEEERFGEKGAGAGDVEASGERGDTGRVRGEATGIVFRVFISVLVLLPYVTVYSRACLEEKEEEAEGGEQQKEREGSGFRGGRR